ncbi:MAG: class I SAM-dependent methyltransferase, partial [Burkholderiales bacterium]
MILDSGIPTSEAYAACVASPLFEDLETYSSAFLKRNRAHLLWYSIRWSEDPLNHPTRRWEYPYTRERLARANGQRVLDAGSGVTFFPYYLMASNPGLTVTCCDRDGYVGEVYNKINRNHAHQVGFERCDLSALPFPDGTFDSIYCISVLEHTGNWE